MDACDQLVARVAPHAAGTGLARRRAVGAPMPPRARAARVPRARRGGRRRRRRRAARLAAIGATASRAPRREDFHSPGRRAGGVACPAVLRTRRRSTRTYGVVATEVEIDVLTGELCLRRCDLHMDQGTPLNAAVDMGQAEGGFVMALGYYLTEEVLWSPDATDARDLTLGTWEYKPPAAHDVPLVFNAFAAPHRPTRARPRTCSAHGGEPPMALAASALFAAREAIASARADAGVSGWFELDAPLTVERVQQACARRQTPTSCCELPRPRFCARECGDRVRPALAPRPPPPPPPPPLLLHVPPIRPPRDDPCVAKTLSGAEDVLTPRSAARAPFDAATRRLRRACPAYLRALLHESGTVTVDSPSADGKTAAPSASASRSSMAHRVLADAEVGEVV